MSDPALTGTDALVKKAKIQLRITTDALNDEVSGLVEAALADMTMRGIDASRLCPKSAAASEMEPLAVRAVMLYCKAHFGVAGDMGERSQYMTCYDSLTQSMALSQEYTAGGVSNAGDESAS